MLSYLTNFSNKIYYYLLILIGITLFVPMQICNVIVVALVINWLIGGNYKQKINKAFSNPLFYLFTSIYLISLIGLIYTSNFKEAVFSLEKQLSLLLFPLIISSSPKLSHKQLNALIKYYIIACIAAIIFTFIYAIYRTTVVTEGYEKMNIFTNEITFIMGASHVYYGLYITFAALCSIYLSYTNKNSYLNFLAIIVYLLVFSYTILITAKISFISLLILSLILKLLFKDFFKVSSLIAIILFLVVFSQMWIHIPKVKQRFIEISTQTENHYYSQRMTAVDCSLKLIKENWLIGVGTGDSFDLLNNCYEEKGIKTFKGLDSHNEYFDFLLTFGIGGFLLFLAVILIPLYLAIKEKQFLYAIFLCHFMICALTENLLDNNKGIVFYAFFNSLLAFNTLSKNEEK